MYFVYKDTFLIPCYSYILLIIYELRFLVLESNYSLALPILVDLNRYT